MSFNPLGKHTSSYQLLTVLIDKHASYKHHTLDRYDLFLWSHRASVHYSYTTYERSVVYCLVEAIIKFSMSRLEYIWCILKINERADGKFDRNQCHAS